MEYYPYFLFLWPFQVKDHLLHQHFVISELELKHIGTNLIILESCSFDSKHFRVGTNHVGHRLVGPKRL